MKVLTNRTISSFINKLNNKSLSSKEALSQVEIALSFINWLTSTDKISQNDSIRYRSELHKAKQHFITPQALSMPFPLKYVGFSLAVLSLLLIGTGIYLRFYKNTKTPFAYSTAPIQAGRIISFQGRLTDTLGNPINAPIDITYNFYTQPTGGTAITGSTRVCTAGPDQDGVFSSLIGNDTGPSCNTELPSSIFTENPNVYLGVTIGSEITEMSPRQQIANVGYAINSETLQGMSPGQNVSNVPFINMDGNLLIAAANPGLRSTYASANFTISSAQATTIQSAGSGDITLSASEGGSLRFKAYNGTLAEVMTILNTGNVGIGNTNPQALLDVSGNATLSGSLVAGGQIKLGEFGSAPTTYGNGSMYYDTTSNKVYFWNGSAWTDMGSGGTQYFQRTLGSLAPTNITDDLNIGAIATGSAMVHLPGLTNKDAFFNLGTGKLGIGDTSPLSLFTVGSGDLFQIDSTGRIVSIDGVAHTIDDISGNLTLTSNSTTISLNDNVTFAGTTTLNGIAYTWPGSQTTNYMLQTNGSGGLSWADPVSAVASGIFWTQSSGALFPKNSTVDAFIGGSATASAKFAFLNVNSGTPTASVSAGVAGAAFLTANGTLSTTARQTLTLGNSSTYNTTGNILLNPNGTGNVGIGTTAPTAKLDVSGNLNVSTYATVGASLAVGYATAPAGPGNAVFSGIVGIGTSAPTLGKLQVVGGNIIVDTTYGLDTSTAGTLALGDTTANAINMGTSALARTIVVGNVTGTTAVNVNTGTAGTTYTTTNGIFTLNTGTGTISLGTDAAAKTITLGNATTTTALALNSGTGDIVLISTDQVKLNSSKAAGGTVTEALSLKSTVDLGAADEVFQIGDSAADMVTVLGNGNVGVGTTNPTAKLDIVGNLNVSTYATVSASLALGSSSAAAGPGNLNMSGSFTVGGPIKPGGAAGANGYLLTSSAGGVNTWTDPATLAGSATLQTTYDLGNTITTTTGRNIDFTLAAGLATPTSLTLTNNHVSNTTDFSLVNANASGTNTNGILVNQTGAGTLTNGINITRTAGVLTNGLTFTGTFGTNVINAPNFIVNNAGNITVAAGQGLDTMTAGILALGDTTANAINMGTSALARTIVVGNVTGTTAVNVNTGTAGTTYTTTNGIFTLNTGTGTISLGTDAAAKTITLGNATTTTALALNSGTGDIVLTSTDQVKLNSSKAAGGTTTEALSLKSTVDLGAADEVFQIGDSAADMVTVLGNGNVGVGTTNPGTQLEVAGQVKITGGTPGVNKVLTSDINGLATWETLGAASIADDSLDFIKFEDTLDLDANLVLNQAAYTWTQNFTGTTTTGLTYNANSLTSGIGALFSSTSTTLTTGGLLSLDWSPGSATAATGDLFSLNIGANGTIGNLFNVKDTGSSLFSVSETAVTSNLPTSFTSPGDVSVAYDLNFTNPTASYIKSAAPLYVQAGETFNSSDLTLKTYNSGDVVLDSPGGVTLAQAQAWTLPTSTTALNVQSGLMNFDTTNSRVGIGSTGPDAKLDVLSATGEQLRLTYTDGTAYTGLTVSSGGDLSIDATGGNVTLASGDNLNLTTAGDLIFGGVTSLAEITSPTDSGAYIVGTNDEFTYSSSSTVQGVLKDLDTQIGSIIGGSSGLWTDGGTVTYLSATIDDLAIGGTTLAASMFGIDESAGNFYLGYDNSANPTLNFEATDGDAGEFGFNTNDSFYFSNANVGIGTTSPTAKLDIVGDASISGSLVFRGTSPATIDILNGARLDFQISDGGDTGLTAKMSILNSGSVGIGTTAPTAKLHLYNGQSHFEGNSTGATTINSNVYGLQVGPLHDRSTTAGTYYSGIAFNHLLNFGGGTTYNGAPQAWIGTLLYDTTGSERDSLVFATKEGTGTSGTGTDIPTPRMVINPLGNVGIGTTGPAGKLDVADTSNTAASLSLTNNTATTIGAGANTLGVVDLQSTSLTTGNLLNVEANALTSGNGLNLTSTSTGLTGDLADITASGSNAAATGNVLKVGLTGALATGTALNVTSAGTSGYALRVNDDGTYTDSTPFVVDYAGNVGVGLTNPTAFLDLAASTTSQASLNLSSSAGTDPSTPISGDFWWNGTNLNFYNGASSTDILAGAIGGLSWTNGGTFVYPTGGKFIGNPTSGGANKIAGLYLADSAPLTFGNTNDVTFSYAPNVLSTTLGSKAWNIASNLLYLKGSTNQIGIGTTNPLATLDIRALSSSTPVASISGVTNMASLVVDQSGLGDIFTASDSGQTRFVIKKNGNVGIGVANPTGLLSIAGSSSTISNSSGDITFDAASNNISFSNDNLISVGNIASIGQIQFGGFAGAPTAIGNGASYYDTLVNKIFYWDGAAWSEMGSKYWQRTLGSLASSNITDDLNIGAIATGSAMVHLPGLTNKNAFFNLGTGSLGVGTPTPNASYRLHVNGNILANAVYDSSNPAFYINPAGDSNLGGNISMYGDIAMTDPSPLVNSYDGAFYNTIMLRGAGDTTTASVCIDEGGTPGSCSGKLDAGTIDPPYTINGDKYATFLPAMTGIKEETTGKVLITEKNDAANAYIKRIELGNQTVGSDLWLFSKVTNLKDQAKDLVVLLSSTTNGKIWYTVNPSDLVLTLYSTTPTEISYRLTAPRFDSYKWSNARGEGEHASGFTIDDRGNIKGGTTPDYTAPQLSYQNNVYALIGNFIEEFTSANKALFGQITTGILQAQKILSPLAEIETLIVRNKIQSPIIETSEIKPTNGDVTINLGSSVISNEVRNLATEGSANNASLDSSPLAQNDKGKLSMLIIKGLNNKPVATIDAEGNASFSGTLTAQSLETQNASLSGTLIAKTIQSENIDQLQTKQDAIQTNQDVIQTKQNVIQTSQDVILNSFQDLNSTLNQVQSDSSSSSELLASQINAVQKELASLKDQPLPNPAYYQNIDASYNNVTVSDTANIYKAHISESLVVGSLFIEPTSILALSSDLRISSLGTIRLFDDAVVIAKNGNIAIKGEVTASSLAIKNKEGKTVASIDASGSARFNEVIAKKFTLEQIATQGALIADSGIMDLENIPIPAIKTNAEIAGTGTLPQDTKEIIIYNDNVTTNSLIYLTPTTNNIQGQLSVTKKITCSGNQQTGLMNQTPTACSPYFVVSSNNAIHSASAFNWLIIN